MPTGLFILFLMSHCISEMSWTYGVDYNFSGTWDPPISSQIPLLPRAIGWTNMVRIINVGDWITWRYPICVCLYVFHNQSTYTLTVDIKKPNLIYFLSLSVFMCWQNISGDHVSFISVSLCNYWKCLYFLTFFEYRNIKKACNSSWNVLLICIEYRGTRLNWYKIGNRTNTVIV